MKRYDIIGEATFDFIEVENGSVILYDDFVSSILARIKELEKDVYIDSEYKKHRIKELKNIIK